MILLQNTPYTKVKVMKGIQLCRSFYDRVVKDIVAPISPSHSACLIGRGSEVLGFDTELSQDHDWAARCVVFTADVEAVRQAMAKQLPSKFEGFETSVEVTEASIFFEAFLGFNPYNISFVDWLNTPTQILRELTGGAVFKESKELTHLRDMLKFYPKDVLLYILEAQWERIGQEMAFMGRCGTVNDNIGSALVCSRLFSYIMRLCFLYEGQYPPYWKWFGTAFSKLACAKNFEEIIQAGLAAKDWKEREKYLSEAYIALGNVHNKSDIAAYVKPGVIPYYTRPFMVVDTVKYKDALRAEIKNKEVKKFPPYIGAVDQISDQTDFLGNNDVRSKLRGIWSLLN